MGEEKEFYAGISKLKAIVKIDKTWHTYGKER